MKKDLVKDIHSSFLSCEKDVENILRKLFVEDPQHGEELKRLLVINTKDCLDNKDSEVYKKKLSEMSVAKLIEEGYIRFTPRLEMPEHEEVKSYIIINFDDFTLNDNNPKFRDCTVSFDIICHTNYWDLGNFRMRPLKIAGYIDGFLNEAKMSGIGVLNFLGAKELLLNEELSGYSLIYRAVHGSDDYIPGEQ